MQLYIATIKPKLSFASMLQSDTLYGAFCWNYKYCYGEEKLEELIELAKQGKPPIIFSNSFPHDTLPLPIGIHDSTKNFEDIKEKQERRKAYQDNKKIKNARYVKKEWFHKIMEGDLKGFTQGLLDDGISEQTVTHNIVSRNQNLVKNIDGAGSLFESREYFSQPGQTYDIYILSSLEEDVLQRIFKQMILLGIGKDKSTGKGSFELEEWKCIPMFQTKNKANGYVALSNFVPAENDPTEGMYKTFTKFGKLDREYAMSEIPFKKPILFLKAGAVFYTDEVKDYYGTCLENVSIMQKVIINAYTIAVPICL